VENRSRCKHCNLPWLEHALRAGRILTCQKWQTWLAFMH
jgi:hypothetical protein